MPERDVQKKMIIGGTVARVSGDPSAGEEDGIKPAVIVAWVLDGAGGGAESAEVAVAVEAVTNASARGACLFHHHHTKKKK